MWEVNKMEELFKNKWFWIGNLSLISTGSSLVLLIEFPYFLIPLLLFCIAMISTYKIGSKLLDEMYEIGRAEGTLHKIGRAEGTLHNSDDNVGEE